MKFERLYYHRRYLAGKLNKVLINQLKKRINMLEAKNIVKQISELNGQREAAAVLINPQAISDIRDETILLLDRFIKLGFNSVDFQMFAAELKVTFNDKYYQMIDQYLNEKNRTIILVDLDGTLANNNHRKHYIQGEEKDWNAFYLACEHDLANTTVINMIKLLEEDGFKIVIVSGRGEIARAKTLTWLYQNEIRHSMLLMRKEGDYRPDEEVKKEMLDKIGRNHVYCVFDDRDKVVDMWRSEGLICFQVAKGDF